LKWLFCDPIDLILRIVRQKAVTTALSLKQQFVFQIWSFQMQLYLNDRQRLLGESAVERTESRVFSAFAKFSDYVKSIDITVKDVNGPRGGIDKVCRVLVKLRGKKDVVINATDSSVSKVIPAAIERAARSVRRQINRREFRGERALKIEV
jgi:ribosome-associated translation inhibitor RaiA